MSNIIQLLERMGQDASLQNQASLEQAITQAEISDELKHSLNKQETDKLAQQLKARTDIVCIIAKPDEDEPDEQPEPSEEIRLLVNS